MSSLTNKKFLDEVGLASLWDKIQKGFAPRWSAYKPVSSLSADLPAASSVNATQNTGNVNINFTSAGILTVDNTEQYGKPIIVTIPAATQSLAGVMTKDDKKKLDNMSSSITTAITLTDIKIDGTALAKADKAVNIGFDYDTKTNCIRLLDANTLDANGDPTPLASVDMDDILSDTFKNSFLHSATVVDRRDEDIEDTGKWIRFQFAVQTNESEIRVLDPFYVDVDDLVDTYTAGTGITVGSASSTAADNEPTTKKISLKCATTSAIGGIRIHKDNSSYAVTAKTSTVGTAIDAVTNDLRYYGVEIDKNDKAFVYMPPETVSVAAANEATQSTLAHAGTFSVMNGIVADVNQSTGDIVLTPQIQPYKLPSETNISIGTAAAATDGGTLAHSGTFTVMTGISRSGTANHTITPVNTTFKLPAKTTITAQAKGANSSRPVKEIVADVNNTKTDSALSVVTNITMSGDQIVPTYTDIWVNVVSIEASTISGLSYPTV